MVTFCHHFWRCADNLGTFACSFDFLAGAGEPISPPLEGFSPPPTPLACLPTGSAASSCWRLESSLHGPPFDLVFPTASLENESDKRDRPPMMMALILGVSFSDYFRGF